MELIFSELGDFSGLFVDSRGRADGLVLLWMKDIYCNIVLCFLRYIDTEVKLSELDLFWYFTSIYGWIEFHSKNFICEFI